MSRYVPVDQFMDVNMHNYRRLSFDDDYLPEISLSQEDDDYFMFFSEDEPPCDPQGSTCHYEVHTSNWVSTE